jgi:putative oxidoreductase
VDQDRLEDAGKLLLRTVVAGLMMFHGFDKLLHGPIDVQADLVGRGLPAWLGYGVYLGEVVAPILILAGAWTRAAALVYSGSIAFATVLVHGSDYLHLKPTGAWAAELWVFYILMPLAVALVGPGRFALARRAFPWD